VAARRKTNKPDPVQVKDQLQAVQSTLRAWGLRHFCAMMIWILAKKPKTFSGAPPSPLVPFRWNRIQCLRHAKMGRNNLEVKSRQIGSTTDYSLTRLFIPAITEPGTGSLLISQSSFYAQKHFGIIRRAYRFIAAVDPRDVTQNDVSISFRENLLHTTYSNRRELIFDQIDSTVLVESAQIEEAGQGITLHHVLADEYSRWPRDPEATLSNIRGAIVTGGTLDRACTANGAAGAFFEAVQRALANSKESDAVLHFYPPWLNIEEYNIALTEKEKDELEKDLTVDELRVIKMMHKDLKAVA
jgi:hypothetical protein